MSGNKSQKAQADENVASSLKHTAFLLQASRKKFGELLREICEVSGFTQGKLAKEAKAERRRLIESGEIHPEDFVGSLEQPTISKVMAGTQEPTYLQVFIWLSVIKTHYKSTQLAELCENLGIAVPELTEEKVRMLWKLSSFISPEELKEIYEQSKNEKPMKYKKLIDHKEKRMLSTRQEVLPTTETNLSSISYPNLTKSAYGDQSSTREISGATTIH